MDIARMVRTILAFTAIALVSGCVTVTSSARRSAIAATIARAAHFTATYVDAGGFTLLTYHHFDRSSPTIRIYIEGDGQAWKTRRELSDDPTPLNPIALRLATADTAANIAYIARPGQFSATGLPVCSPTYWSQRRFSPEVVRAIAKTVDALKEKSGARTVELVGYSGGGALAVLVAAKRNDVQGIRTVAGNLDSAALCAHHRTSPLDGSLNPIDCAVCVAHIPQRHFVGTRDTVVPVSIAYRFVERAGDAGHNTVTVVEGAPHTAQWQEHWQELVAMPIEAPGKYHK